MSLFKKPIHTDVNAVAKKGIKWMDAVVTGVILWGIVASLYGVKKLKEKSDEAKHHGSHEWQTNLFEHTTPKERRWFFKRFFWK